MASVTPSSENAFAYRKALRADCTCNGRDSGGLAPIDISLDGSLRSGDVIATASGLVAYTGIRVGNDQTAEFTPVASYPGLTAEVRARLGEMKVAPVSAGSGRGCARREVRETLRRDGAEDAASDPGEERVEASAVTPERSAEARSQAGLNYRPTITPITFGAARYFSSIAARAAARFSAVSRPRFSAKIIQQKPHQSVSMPWSSTRS